MEFDRNEHRLDDFCFKDVCVQKYDELSYVTRIILTLSHGQASVERGFSQNVTVLETNMTLRYNYCEKNSKRSYDIKKLETAYYKYR